jgi:Domain of unknown function (DUF4845)
MADIRAKSLVGVTAMNPSLQVDHRLNRLRGMSTMGMVLLLVAVAMGLSFGLKIVPHYMNFRTMQTLLAGLTEEEVKTASRAEVMALLQKRFKINSLYDEEPEKIVKYTRERGAVSLAIDYEVREHLFGNVYVLLEFKESRTF